jgi:rubrerythrin
LSLQDELSEILSKTEQSDDLEQLAGFQRRCEVILANVSKTLLGEQDAELREHLQAIEEQAKDTLHAVKQRLAEVKIARMDPEYEQRKAQKQREEELTPAAVKCVQCGTELKPGAKFCPECGTPVPREKHCANCGAKLVPTAKFCPECGTKQG